MKFIIAPSILAADFAHLSREIDKIQQMPNSWVHLDIMDAHFVPNLSFGVPVIKSIRSITKLPFDAHLMVDNPEFFFSPLKDAGVNYITFHIEQTNVPLKLIRKIKNLGLKAGISLKPATPISEVENILPYVDILLVMSVEPGFSGQKFINSSLQKIEKAKEIRESKKLHYLISVDGGINNKTAVDVLKAGADILVMGSYFFKNPFKEVKAQIEKLIESNF